MHPRLRRCVFSFFFFAEFIQQHACNAPPHMHEARAGRESSFSLCVCVCACRPRRTFSPSQVAADLALHARRSIQRSTSGPRPGPPKMEIKYFSDCENILACEILLIKPVYSFDRYSNLFCGSTLNVLTHAVMRDFAGFLWLKHEKRKKWNTV